PLSHRRDMANRLWCHSWQKPRRCRCRRPPDPGSESRSGRFCHRTTHSEDQNPLPFVPAEPGGPCRHHQSAASHPGVGYRRYPRSQSLRYRWCRKTADTRFPMSWFVSLQSPRRGS
ncbi:hypothetical protein HEAFMP_HEAFMP_15870, partial [Dysosmobacter welbionis]